MPVVAVSVAAVQEFLVYEMGLEFFSATGTSLDYDGLALSGEERTLIGWPSEFRTCSHGSAVVHSLPWLKQIMQNRRSRFPFSLSVQTTCSFGLNAFGFNQLGSRLIIRLVP